MRDIAAVMVTVDRSLLCAVCAGERANPMHHPGWCGARPHPFVPGSNYLAETLENLRRSGMRQSDRLRRLDLVSPDIEWAAKAGTGTNCMGRNPANLNVASALRIGVDRGTPWVLFLEDDIDVCADFFDSVGRWLDDHAREDRRIYPLGANYGWVQEAARAGRTAADYPIGQFYGTQAVAMRSEDAADFADYLWERSGTRVWQTLPDGTRRLAAGGTGYDLIMGYWHRERYPDIDHFLTPCPSFVQHIGMESVILPREGVHTFPSWPGRHWTYGDPLPAAASAEVVA